MTGTRYLSGHSHNALQLSTRNVSFIYRSGLIDRHIFQEIHIAPFLRAQKFVICHYSDYLAVVIFSSPRQLSTGIMIL